MLGTRYISISSDQGYLVNRGVTNIKKGKFSPEIAFFWCVGYSLAGGDGYFLS